MPKLRKRRRRSIDIEDQPDVSPNSTASTTSDRRSWTVRKPQYRHYAAHIRNSGTSRLQDDLSETSTAPSTSMVIGVFTLSVLICFGTAPDATLRMLLLGEMLFCNFPPFFANWVVLITVLLPMKIQSRTEVVLGLAMLSWISNLEWAYAWERVKYKIICGQIDDWDDSGLET